MKHLFNLLTWLVVPAYVGVVIVAHRRRAAEAVAVEHHWADGPLTLIASLVIAALLFVWWRTARTNRVLEDYLARLNAEVVRIERRKR